MKDGDIIDYNGKPCRIEAGVLAPVVQRGPLGGEVKRIGDIKPGTKVILHATLGTFVSESDMIAKFDGYNLCPELSVDTIAETNIPARPTFTPMTAGEAAKLPDIVGQWVAVKVDTRVDNGIVSQCCWFGNNDKILLIEGVDLL